MSVAVGTFVEHNPLNRIIDQYQNQVTNGSEQNDLLHTYVRDLRNRLSQLQEFSPVPAPHGDDLHGNHQELSSLRALCQELRSEKAQQQEQHAAVEDDLQVQIQKLEEHNHHLSNQLQQVNSQNVQLRESLLLGQETEASPGKQVAEDDKVSPPSDNLVRIRGDISFRLDEQAMANESSNIPASLNLEDVVKNPALNVLVTAHFLLPSWQEYLNQSKEGDVVFLSGQFNDQSYKQELILKRGGLTHITKEVTTITRKIESLSSNPAYSGLKDDFDEVLEKLEKLLVDLEPVQTQIAERLTELEHSELEMVKSLQEEIDSKKAEVSRLSADLEISQTQMNNLQSQSEEVRVKTEQIQKLEEELKEAEGKLEEAMVGQGGDQELVQQLDAKEQELDQAIEEIERLQQILAQSEAGNDPDLEMENHYLQSDIQKMTLELEELGVVICGAYLVALKIKKETGIQ
eukprot:TRINITY_DN824_c0_g1_i7.p1 TRINITY_DN824_c0_g1~~TRINITY_DN824_c0_g1_i7.p1  ORF type:complete len:460 (-),score=91.40 TRINITY_DN824_c0_g1_i7:19-1398(-)